MKLEEYEMLPDILSVDELEQYSQGALTDFSAKNTDKEVFLQILSQLMDRQVMTYELLRDEIRDEIDNVLCELWNTNSYHDVDIILSIVVNLGLKSCFEKIKDSISQEHHIDSLILHEIQETIDEIGENIANPYHDLEKFK
ncbi:hypothetical protein ACEOWJ_001768 [Bacillus cereus]|uniref:hypothetical protein n=1 Tax=Bacillus pseudomycoides TaxID=64104 RepID=UPI00300018A4